MTDNTGNKSCLNRKTKKSGRGKTLKENIFLVQVTDDNSVGLNEKGWNSFLSRNFKNTSIIIFTCCFKRKLV